MYMSSSTAYISDLNMDWPFGERDKILNSFFLLSSPPHFLKSMLKMHVIDQATKTVFETSTSVPSTELYLQV